MDAMGKDGRVRIPLWILRNLGWQSGIKIRFDAEPGKVTISPVECMISKTR